VADPDVFIIAEAGVNHNGDPERALEMIDVAAAAGADAIKFQTFVPAALASRHAGKAAYQVENEGLHDTQLQMLERLALPFELHHDLQARCAAQGIRFLSSPFDIRSADFLIDELGLEEVKLGSGELTNGPLLWHIAERGVAMILSTGMAGLDEVLASLGLLSRAYQGMAPPTRIERLALDFRPEALLGHVRLMHCTTAYPCPVEQVNLRAMQTLSAASGLPTGYSDHTAGNAVSLAAAALGATLIEKHFTLDRALPGPDHAASLEPAELAALVAGVRAVCAALGCADKTPTGAESQNAAVVRKSLVAAGPIAAGQRFDRRNLTSKRPADGLSPMRYWQLLGQTAGQAYREDDPIL
jgi:N-acetylneuraminate synthase